MSEEATLVGSVLDGRYRVDRVIGAGGFGTVYEGFHLTLGHPVAIKLFRIADDTSSTRRAELLAGFVEEARLLTRLRHDNIVRMLDQGFVTGVGAPTGSPYAVMEYCPHGSLRDLMIQRGALPLGEALALVKGIVAGMRHAHESGIAHRDLKPGNVMLHELADGSRVPRIIDFGIAKLIEEGDTAGSGATRTRSTAVVFTPAYAAPEQAIGGRTGMWTDVHAIGLIFCELLTGAPPYGRDELSLKIIDPVRPTPAALGVDAGPFEPVIKRALAIRPDERYPDAAALERALAEAESAPPKEHARGSHAGRRAALIGAGALLSAGAAWLAFGRKGDGPEPAPVATVPSSASTSASAPAASASVAAPSVPTVATLTAGQVVARMLSAGLSPITTPAPDASTQQLMIAFRQADSIGAVYTNEITIPPDVTPDAHAMITLMNVRAWVTSDRQQGYELAYVIEKNRVFSMTWAPKPDAVALACFDKLIEGLRFQIRGASWTRDDPSSNAKLSKGLWCAKKLGDLTSAELLLRLEANDAVAVIDPQATYFRASLERRKVRGEVSFFAPTGAADDARALEIAAELKKQKRPFVMATDGGAAIVGEGALANEAFLSEALAGLGAVVARG